MKIDIVNNEDFSVIEKIIGKDIMHYASQENKEELKVIGTGSISLNKALGIGGYPVGKIIEIYGNESSGKTTLTLHAIAEAQKLNKRCLFVDIENSLDINYAKNIGIDIDKLLIAHPTSGEQTFDLIEYLIKENKIDVIVIDSVAAMIPSQEIENNINDQQMGLHARMMSKGLRRIQSLLLKHECTIFFINQIREKIGVFFGNPETTTGGKALKFYSTLRLEVRKSDLIKENNDKIGIESKITIVKNKISSPLKTAYINIYFSEGFNYDNEIIDFAIEYDVIKKSGS